MSSSPVDVLLPDAPRAPREPDGVVLEAPAAMPEAAERTPALGVVALREPLGNEAVLTVVHRLFRAFTRADAEALQAIVTEDAVSLAPARAKGPLLEQWRTRLKNPGLARLTVLELVDDDRIVRFSYDDLGGPSGPSRPAAMRPGDVLVRFPIAGVRGATEPVFGDAMTLLLRRDGQTFKIAGASEEDEP